MTRGERKRQEVKDLEEEASQAASQAERAAAAEAAQMQEDQDAREKNINEAQAYLDKVKEDKAAGVISDEEAAKKEALAFALVQLGAGIAKGDLAEGLQKAGETASEIVIPIVSPVPVPNIAAPDDELYSLSFVPENVATIVPDCSSNFVAKAFKSVIF